MQSKQPAQAIESDDLQTFLLTLKEPCLLLARHGETDWNANNLIQGQQDRPLSPLGYQQRKNLFYMLLDVPIKQIYTSQLQRTIETARPISEAKQIVMQSLSVLNEAKLGVFEGEHKVNFADAYSKEIYNNFLKDEVNIALPGGGENLKMVYARIRSKVDHIIDSVDKSGHSLVVAHRNVNKMIIKHLLDLSFEEGFQVEHKNNWLYIFAPRSRQLFVTEIPSPGNKILIHTGFATV